MGLKWEEDMNFQLNDWQIEYAKSIAKYANNKKISNNLRNIFPYPYTIEDARWYANECIHADPTRQCVKVITVEGQAVGCIGVSIQDDVHCKSAEIGYWLGVPFWNKGIMTKAIRQMSKIAFEQLDIVRIFAEPFAYNTGSRKSLEKAGYQLEGVMRKSIYKNGNIYDSCIYSLIK